MFRLPKTSAFASQITRLRFNSFEPIKKCSNSAKPRQESVSCSTHEFSIRILPNSQINARPKSKFLTKFMFFLLGTLTGLAIADAFNMQMHYKSPTDFNFDFKLGAGAGEKNCEEINDEEKDNDVLTAKPSKT